VLFPVAILICENLKIFLEFFKHGAAMLQGKVYLVGADPGDAELITLKGYQLIAAADVILPKLRKKFPISRKIQLLECCQAP